jgi:membrane protein implicated in regulation of membrane protease activity
MKRTKPRSPAQLLLLALAIGFLLSFLSVIATIVLSINDQTVNVPVEVHFVIWAGGTAVALLVLRRQGN